MSPDILDNKTWREKIADMHERLIQTARRLDSATKERDGFRAANKTLQEVVCQLGQDLGNRDDAINALQEELQHSKKIIDADTKVMSRLQEEIRLRESGGTIGRLRDEIKALQEIIGERDTEWERLKKDHKSKNDTLDVTLINLSNARGELGKLRGTDEHTAHKMKQRIAELECLVLQAAVDKQVLRPDTKDETTRDIAIACSKHQAIQTGIRWAMPTIALIIVSLLMVVKAFAQ